MSLTPQTTQGLIQAKASAGLISGSKFPSFVAAVSTATCQYVLASASVNSTNIALGPGSGTQIGRIVGLEPNSMSSLIVAKAASVGIAGKDLRKIADAVSFGVCNSMQTVVMQGTIIGAGPGTGTGRITGLVPTALVSLILAQGAVRLLSGSKLKDIISAIAFGICTHIMTTATVSITNLGVAASPPVGPITIPAAPGIGRLT